MFHHISDIENRAENATRSGVFFVKYEVIGM